MSNLKKWTQKDGTKIRIKDMTDSHLVNTIKMLVRTAGIIQSANLCSFPSFDPDSMAQYVAEQEWDNLNEMDVMEYAEQEYPLFNDLMDEIYNRDLEDKI